MSIPAVVFSIFLIAAISPIGLQDNTAVAALPTTPLNCYQVDQSSYGECKTSYTSSKDGFRDCKVGVTCTKDQTVEVTNDLNSNEKAKINLALEQYLNCEDDYCKRNYDFYAFNDAKQKVEVTSTHPASKINFDVDLKMKQESDSEGQDPDLQRNDGKQIFDIDTNGPNAHVYADNSGVSKDVRLVMDQINKACDQATCLNDGEQKYFLDAIGNSKIDLSYYNSAYSTSGTQGFQLSQKNYISGTNGCDDDDYSSGQVSCINESDQKLDITAEGKTGKYDPTTQVTFDTEGLSTTTQSLDCAFTVKDDKLNCYNKANVDDKIDAKNGAVVDLKKVNQKLTQSIDSYNDKDAYKSSSADLTNDANLNIEVYADRGYSDKSIVGADSLKQEGEQKIYASKFEYDTSIDPDTAQNKLDAKVLIATGEKGQVKVKSGQQISKQSITSCASLDCKNDAKMIVGLGYQSGNGGGPFNKDSTLNDPTKVPVTGYVESTYKQTVTQDITKCAKEASCANKAILEYFATAGDDAKVYSTSDQSATQSISCDKYDQMCSNFIYERNNVNAKEGSTIYSDVTQKRTQSCTTYSGQSCNNVNNIIADASAFEDAKLTYKSTQSLTQNGDASININAGPVGSPHNLGHIQQYQPAPSTGNPYTYP